MKYGSLFTGFGGMDLGLDRAGLNCSWQVENEPYAIKVLERHWPNVERITDVVGWQPGKRKHRVDLIAGGFPCQDISEAGNNRKGLDGNRSGLWFEMLRIIDRLRPTFVLVENVTAIRRRGLSVVLDGLSRIGFDAEWATIRAAQFGFAHIRARTFILAYSNRFNWDAGSDYSTGELHNSRSEWNAQARACSHGGDVQRWIRETYAVDGFPTNDPDTKRKIDGIPNRVERLRGVGNAVVPDVAEWIGRRVMSMKPV